MIKHITKHIHFINETTIFSYENKSSLNRHRRRVYEHLNVKRWEKLEEIKFQIENKTHDLLYLFSDILVDFKEKVLDMGLLEGVIDKINNNGGAAALHADCEQAAACDSKNYLPLLWQFYESKISTLFKLIHTLYLQSATQNDYLIRAMNTILYNQDEKSEYLAI